MDVIYLSKNSIRIKGKNASLIIDPTQAIAKTEAQIILALSQDSEFSDAKVEGGRITIKGQGEYEVNGVKVSAFSASGGLIAVLEVDGVRILTGAGEIIEKIQDKGEASDILLVNANKQFNYSVLSALEPKVIIVYGDKSSEVKKSLGKENVVKSTKYQTTSEKLPQEMEFVLFE